MLHRHLNHERYTLAAIDNVIARGRWRDWADMRLALIADPSLIGKIEHICRQYISDPYAQRQHFWMNYCAKKRGGVDYTL